MGQEEAKLPLVTSLIVSSLSFKLVLFVSRKVLKMCVDDVVEKSYLSLSKMHPNFQADQLHMDGFLLV